MSYVKILRGSEAREAILKGAAELAESVLSTLGPSGRNASISRKPVMVNGKERQLPPLITKDGVSVANEITSLPDPFENMGVQIVKEAAQNTNRTGDGTTTATLLAYEMMKAGAGLINSGANAIHIRRGMDKACEIVCEKLASMSKKIETLEELKAIGTISSQDKEIGTIVAEAVDAVGKEGAVTMQVSNAIKTECKITSGMQIATGYASHYFGKNGVAQIDDPFILVTTEKIASIRTLGPILDQITNLLNANPATKGEPLKLVIFSTGVSGDAFTTMIKNHIENPKDFQFLILNPPYFGERQKETLEDIAISTGAKLIDKSTGRTIEDMKFSDLGTCGKIIANSGLTTIVDSHGITDKIEERIALIKEKLEVEEDQSNKDYLKSRLAGLSGKIANILVGGSSQMEQKEKLHRVEDAIAATRAAHETGILPGGGVAFIRCIEDVTVKDDESRGFSIVMDALDKQLFWVAKNAGEDAMEVIEKVMGLSMNEGFNAEKREYGDMFEMKVIDPAKVPISALRNAVSVAGAFLTIETACVEIT